MRYLFWNTHKNENINSIIAELVLENNISFVILAEYSANVNELTQMLDLKGVAMQQYYCVCDRIVMLGSAETVDPGLDTDHATIRVINNDYILCGIHLNSKLFSDHEAHREILIEQIIHDIKSTEQELGMSKTVVVGDFNMNPFDSSCVDARYFHGLPIYEETRRKSRKIAGQDFMMFYNPMWNLLGDFEKPYGTYYYAGNDTVNTFWNLYDQVIIRPSLRPRFVDQSLRILTETEETSLLGKNGHPKRGISNHLPITFEIKENSYE
ncbi:MAG: hypothetical protein LUD78_01980 [Clostridiales bacterium]|nr:hypothetical protein [Clostridiales bacterium]